MQRMEVGHTDQRASCGLDCSLPLIRFRQGGSSHGLAVAMLILVTAGGAASMELWNPES